MAYVIRGNAVVHHGHGAGAVGVGMGVVTGGGTVSRPPGVADSRGRRDGIALGGTSVEGDWSLVPDEEARRRIVEAHIDLFRRMA